MDTSRILKLRRRNVAALFGMSFFQVFLVIMPVAVPFFQSKGLGMQDVFLLQSVFAAVVLLTEVPSGYVADLFGRRRALLAGAIAGAVGHSALFFADGFWGLVVFEVFLALAHSLISGADLAYLYDESEDSQRASMVGRLYSVRTGGEALAALVCTAVLLFADLPTLVLVQIAIGWIPVVLALQLREAHQRTMSASAHLRNFRQVLTEIWGQGGVMRLTFLALAVWSLTTFHAVWLIQKVWSEEGVTLADFGYLWAALMLLAALAGQFAHRLERLVGPRLLLTCAGLLPVFGYLGLGLSGLALALAAASFFVARGVGAVLLQEAFNRRLQPEFRATANSVASFAFRLGFLITGPVVGWMLDVWALTAALWVLAGFALAIFAGLVLPLIFTLKAGSNDVRERVSNGG